MLTGEPGGHQEVIGENPGTGNSGGRVSQLGDFDPVVRPLAEVLCALRPHPSLRVERGQVYARG